MKLKIFALPLLVFLFINLASYTAYKQSGQVEQEFRQQHFAQLSDRYFNIFRQAVVAKVDVAVAMQAFYHGSKFVSREEFRDFSLAILKNHPDIQSLNWLPKITHDKRAEYEQNMRDKGFKNFSILETAKGSQTIPAIEKGIYFPLHYLEPFESNKKAFALDSSSNPIALQAINQVLASQQLAVSQPLTLMQETASQKSILIFLPIYKRQALKGLVEVVLRMGDVLKFIQKNYDFTNELSIKLTDIAGATPLLIAAEPQNLNTERGPFIKNSDWFFGDHLWNIEILASQGFIDRYQEAQEDLFYSYLMRGPIIGFILSLLIFFLLLQKNKAEHNANQLRSSQLHFKRLINQTSDSYFLHDTKGKFLDVNQQICKALGYSREELLKMSIAEMSVQSQQELDTVWQSFKLNEIKIIESEQVHKDGHIIPVELT